MRDTNPDLHSHIQALGSTLCAGVAADEMLALGGRLDVAGSELTRAALAAEPEWEEDGYYSDTLRGVAETLADGLRTYPADVAKKVGACIAEGRTSDLWKVLP